MRDLAFCAELDVMVTGDDDLTVLDLVAHFLGIAMHHNDNKAPSAIAALEVISETEIV
jgi:hypothetical protein